MANILEKDTVGVEEVTKNENNNEEEYETVMVYENKVLNFFAKNLSLIRICSLVTICFVIVFGFYLINMYILTGSMNPTLPTGVRVIAVRSDLLYTEKNRDDIISFTLSDFPIEYCKRIVAMPGEVFEVRQGHRYIDGVEVPEPYLDEAHTVKFMTEDIEPVYVPQKGDKVTIDDTNCYINGYWVGYSVNMKTSNYENEEKIVKPFMEEYCEEVNGEYIVKEDCYFALGDNRDISLDGRYWVNRYIRDDKIAGRIAIAFNGGPHKL